MNKFLSLGVIFALAAALAVQLTARDKPVEDPKYRRYNLIDLGTLGGPDSYHVFGKTLNNRGEFIAQSTTSVPDPYCPDNCFSDGFVTHPILREPNGVIGRPCTGPGRIA